MAAGAAGEKEAEPRLACGRHAADRRGAGHAGGRAGPARQWAIRHQIAVGEFFDAPDFVPVGQAHVMADTESLGEAGVAWLEELAALPRAPSGACAFPPSPIRAGSTSTATSA